MMVSKAAKKIAAEFDGKETKMGDIKKLGKEIKKDHDLAMELWSTGGFACRMLSMLIFDKKLLTQDVIDQLAADMRKHEEKERNQLADWLMANQLMKDKKTVALLNTWAKNRLSPLRRLYWYHQARLRWSGQTPPDNTGELVDSLERELSKAPSDVQWAMNFCAGQIGIHEPKYRARCIRLGKELGLYKDEKGSKNCTPNYLPEFIRIEVAKRDKTRSSG